MAYRDADHQGRIWGRIHKKVYTRIADRNQKEQEKRVNIKLLCKLFGISRQGYYKKLSNWEKEAARKEKILYHVSKQRKIMGRLGTRKLYKLIGNQLKIQQLKCGRDKLFTLLREEGLQIRPRRNYTRTTNSYHRFYKYSNLIKELKITRPEQVWVSDITYIKCQSGHLYLSLITDAYSKQIMGYELSDNLKTINCIRTLRMAVKNRKYPGKPLIHHSDRGFQYCNPEYIKLLNKHGIDISMTTKSDPYENAIAERVNGILKDEFSIGGQFPGFMDARREISHAIWVYNHKRPHLSCQMMTPAKAHRSGKYELKKWKKRFFSSNILLEKK